MRIATKRTLTAVALTGLTLGAAGVAVAYFTTTGTGTGTATTGDVVAVTVKQTSTITGLAPGLSPQTLSGNFDNPNAGPVYITAVTAAVTATDKAGCAASNYAITGTAPVGAEVPAGNAQGAWTGLQVQLVNDPLNSQDACKNAGITITYTAS